jgi:hypothetical protein
MDGDRQRPLALVHLYNVLGFQFVFLLYDKGASAEVATSFGGGKNEQIWNEDEERSCATDDGDTKKRVLLKVCV